MADEVTTTTTEVNSPSRRVLLISAGASHSVALLTGNVVCSWGRGEDGQLGHGDAEDRLLPTHISALDGVEIVGITCGADHTTAYSESQMQMYSWGWGDFGRLGHGNSSDVFAPQPIKALQGVRIKQIACGDSHCLAVTMEGEVHSWGRNQNGQLGLGTIEDSLLPQKIEAFKGISIKMIAAGAEHTAAVTEDGELYGWGWGRYGNLGLGDRNDRLVPHKVSSVDGQKMILVACGWRHTISVSSSGGLYTYGWSKYGQLGHGDFEDHLFPHQLEALRNSSISQISGGWRHTMAITSDGKLYGWGWNKVSRSPVFKAMLENEMEESRSGTIKITDVSYDVLRSFIHYLYTAEASLDEQMACDLLVLAEKYQVKHLKAYCENFLMSKLNGDNAILSFAFASHHNAKHLLEASLSLVMDNMNKLTKQEEYKELVEKDPRLVVGIYEAYVSRQVNTAASKDSATQS